METTKNSNNTKQFTL